MYSCLNQIAGLFDLQYLWKESINVLDFLHRRGSYQRKETSESIAGSWAWSFIFNLPVVFTGHLRGDFQMKES